MAQIPKQKPNAGEVRHLTDETLSRDGNRMTLVQAILVCLLFVPLCVSVFNAYSVMMMLFPLAGAWQAVGIFALLSVYELLALFLILPTLMGLYAMAAGICEGRAVTVAELFCCFTTKRRYRRALAFGGRAVVRFCIVSALCIIADASLSLLFPGSSAILWVRIAVIILLCVGGILWHFASYTALFFTVEHTDLPVSVTCEMPHTHMAGKPLPRGLRFFGYAALRLLLGLLTLGILWIWDTVPRLLITYYYDARDARNTGEGAPNADAF